MKTKLFLSIALMLLFINAHANDNAIRKESTVTESKVEETIIYNEETNKPIKKSICQLNSNNQIIEITIYKIDEFRDSLPVYKVNMEYDTPESKTPSIAKYSIWCPVASNWKKHSTKIKNDE